MNVTLTTRIHELIVTALKCSSVEGDITKPEALEAIAALKAQGSNEDANNYCLILSVLGMEEEGDPVAEVTRLKDAEEAAAGVSLDQPLMHHFHQAWTASVGEPGYDKAAWQSVRTQIERFVEEQEHES